MEMTPYFNRQDSLKHCLSSMGSLRGPEDELSWQEIVSYEVRKQNCVEKKRKQPCGSPKGAVPPDKETLEAAVSPLCTASGMHSHFPSEQERDNVKKPQRHLTFLSVSLFIARQRDSLGFFLKVERYEKKIQV